MTKVLAFAGSTREKSLNKRLVRYAADQIRTQGADVTLIDLRDFPLPLYDGDLEAKQDAPKNADRLFHLMKEHRALLLACPEYNGSVTGVFKNTIDWLSRPRPGEENLAAFQGKVAALLSASPGRLGGMRGLIHVRMILSGIGVLVLPDQVAVPKAHEAFDDQGNIRDESLAGRVEKLSRNLVQTAGCLAGVKSP